MRRSLSFLPRLGRSVVASRAALWITGLLLVALTSLALTARWSTPTWSPRAPMSAPLAPLTAAGLRQFLRTTRAALPHAPAIVLGNESGDLDSSVAALVYAYHLSLAAPAPAPVPLLNYPAADLPLRPETVAVLRQAECGAEDVVFVDLLDWAQAGVQRVHLVDHNRLCDRQSFLAPLVHTVIDHHVDESHDLPHLVDKRIETVGSACTLIAERLLLAHASLDAPLARLLLSPILSDTFNLTRQADRTTPKDRDVAARLARLMAPQRPLQDVYDELFEFVERAKYNTEGMSSADLLRKDYKQWRLLPAAGGAPRFMGIAAVPLALPAWLSRDPHLLDQLDRFTHDRSLDILFLMGMFHDDLTQFQRQVGVYVPQGGDSTLMEAVQAHLAQLDGHTVRLEEASSPRLALYDVDVKYSRKKLSPLLSDFLKQH